LFPGVDPTDDVTEAAGKLGKTLNNGKFLNISMGQGVESYADESLKIQAERGDWLLL